MYLIYESLSWTSLLHLLHLAHRRTALDPALALLLHSPTSRLHLDNFWLLASSAAHGLRLESLGALRLLDILFKLFVLLLAHLVHLVFRVLLQTCQHFLSI